MKKKNKFIFIAHRGIYNNLNIPENSMKSFKRAINSNVSIELDIHLTKDNKLVVFHDDNLIRMTGTYKKIRKCMYDELKQFNLLSTEEKIPLLSDVLKLVDGKVLIDIEIKDDKRISKTCKELIKLLDNYNGFILIQSFHPKYINYLKKVRPKYICGLLITNAKGFCYNIMDSKIILDILKPDFIAYNKNIISCRKVQKLREKMCVISWTIKSREELENIKKYSDSIITEYFE